MCTSVAFRLVSPKAICAANEVRALVRRNDGLGALDHFGRGAVKSFHQRLDIGAADEVEVAHGIEQVGPPDSFPQPCALLSRPACFSVRRRRTRNSLDGTRAGLKVLLKKYERVVKEGLLVKSNGYLNQRECRATAQSHCRLSNPRRRSSSGGFASVGSRMSSIADPRLSIEPT